jgi:hypothetical protein
LSQDAAQEKRMQELFFHWLYILLQNKENSWKDKRLTYRDKKSQYISILGFLNLCKFILSTRLL